MRAWPAAAVAFFTAFVLSFVTLVAGPLVARLCDDATCAQVFAVARIVCIASALALVGSFGFGVMSMIDEEDEAALLAAIEEAPFTPMHWRER